VLLRRFLGAPAEKAVNGGVPDSRDDADEPQWNCCIRSTLPHCQGGDGDERQSDDDRSPYARPLYPLLFLDHDEQAICHSRQDVLVLPKFLRRRQRGNPRYLGDLSCLQCRLWWRLIRVPRLGAPRTTSHACRR